ncbi:MAG: protein kinase, partial [Myxococcota bacterium]
DHPNIVRVHDVGGGAGSLLEPDAGGLDELCDPPYIVMELVRGSSLDSALAAHYAEHGPPLGEIVAAIGAVMCSALGQAHQAGIVHRDVKPSNIMVADDGRLALADFGVARVADDDSSLVTRTGALIGTPSFMSPEQATGDELDTRSDVYSLGATLYKLATGAVPYHGSTARVVAAIVRGDRKPPMMRNPAMGSELAQVIEHMMAEDPDDRFQSCAEAEDALRAIITNAGLGEAADELRAFFAEPAEYAAERRPRIAAATLNRARQHNDEGRSARAMALADRVLALDADGPLAAEALALVEQMGASDRRNRWLVIAAALTMMVAAAVGTAALWPGDTQPEQSTDAPARDSRAAHPADAATSANPAAEPQPNHDPDPLADAGPSPALAEADADADADAAKQTDPVPTTQTDAGDNAPATRPARSARRTGARRTVAAASPSRDAGPKRSAPPDSGAPDSGLTTSTQPDPTAVAAAPAVDAAPADAVITLDIRPWCDVAIDGRSYGRAQRDRQIALAPGRHQVVCSQGVGRPQWSQTITLAPGERRALRGSVLKPVQVRVEISGDSVIIAGKRYRNRTTIALPPNRYRVDVYSGKSKGASDYVFIPAVASCTLRDRPDLDCY